MSAAIQFVSHGALQKRHLCSREITVRPRDSGLLAHPFNQAGPRSACCAKQYSIPLRSDVTLPWQLNRLTRSAVEQEVNL